MNEDDDVSSVAELLRSVRKEIAECSTKRRKWWAIEFEDGSYFGESEDGEGFSLNLYNAKEDAEQAADEFLDGVDVFFRVVQVHFARVGA